MIKYAKRQESIVRARYGPAGAMYRLISPYEKEQIVTLVEYRWIGCEPSLCAMLLSDGKLIPVKCFSLLFRTYNSDFQQYYKRIA